MNLDVDIFIKITFIYSCVSIEEHQAADIDLYHCPECQKTHGPLKCKLLQTVMSVNCVLHMIDVILWYNILFQ